MGEIRDLGGLLQRAGLRAAGGRQPALRRELSRRAGADARPAGDGRDQRDARPAAPADARARCWRAPRRSMPSASATADGRVRATFDVIFLTGWAPAPDQPQPLRPGSARARLADALGAEERSAGERPRRRLSATSRDGRAADVPAGGAPGATRPPITRRCRRPRIGVVLANLGTPDATDYWSMRRYLGEFLSDRRVIDYPRWKWQPLLQLVILSKRPFTSGANYRKIWNTRGRREPAADHHPGADRGGGGAAGRALRRPGRGRFRDALRQPLDRLGDRAAAGARAASGSCSSRSIRSIRRRPPPPPTTRRSGR